MGNVRPTFKVVGRAREGRRAAARLSPHIRRFALPKKRRAVLALPTVVPGAVGALLGTTIAMVIVGLAAGFERLLAKYPSSVPTVLGPVAGAALLSLGVGVCVPQRFALWISQLAWRRFLSRGEPSDMSRLLLSAGEVDRPLAWVVLSIVVLFAGVLTAILPLNLSLAGAFLDWMHVHFVWSVGPLAVFQAAVVFLTGVAPLTMLGLALSCVLHLNLCGTDFPTAGMARPTRAVCPTYGWLLIGAAGGGLMATWIFHTSSRANLVVVAAALPALIAAVLSAVASSSGSPRESDGRRAEADTLPLWSDRWPRLLRTAVVAVGGCGTCAVAVWTLYLVANGSTGDKVLAVLLVGMGVGFLAGGRRKRQRPPSLGGFGVASAAAGVMVAAGTGALFVGGSPGPALWVVACAGPAAIGFATAYGRWTVVGRVAHVAATETVVLSRLLVCSGVMVWVGVPVAEHLVSTPGMLAAVGLFLLALGGTLIVYEPDYSARTRRVRLAAVFGCVAAMIAVGLFMPRAWQQAPAPRRPEPTPPLTTAVQPTREFRMDTQVADP